MGNPIPFEQMAGHGAIVNSNHDGRAHENFAQAMHFEVFAELMPGNKAVFLDRVEPRFRSQNGISPANRQQVRKEMREEPFHQFWSALRRTTQEMMWRATGECLHHTDDELHARIDQIRSGDETLKLNPALEAPRYVTAVDIHCMPGGYCSELRSGDAYAGAIYDRGVYSITQGFLGPKVDAIGTTIIEWIKSNHSNLWPKSILDVGCAVGHSTLPLCDAYPESEVHAVDVSAPMLRYASARARSLGYQVFFEQMNAEEMSYPDHHFDLVVSSATLHELSTRSIKKILAEIHRVLKPGGLMVHVEQPQYEGMSPYDQFMRDWDTFGNNEPFWGTLHDLDLEQVAVDAGFDRGTVKQTREHGGGGQVYNVESKDEELESDDAPNWFFYTARK